MSGESEKIRLECVSGNTKIAADRVARYFSLQDIQFNDFYTPPQRNHTLIVFVFSNKERKQAVLNLPNLNEELEKCKTKIYISPSNPSTDNSHRMAFIYKLNPHYFTCYTTEDGAEFNETIDDKKNQLIEALKEKLGEGKIEDYHYIENRDRSGRKQTPRTMTITFKDLETTEEFIKSDTRFPYGIIRADQKCFHRNIPIIQCNVCRKTGHRNGHFRCDRIQRCPRCLSRFHAQPTPSCEPYCHTHGEGHSTGSDLCPFNIDYRKRQRSIIANKEKIVNQTKDTAADKRQLHQDVLNLSSNLQTKSYAGAIKGLNSNNTPAPNPVNAQPLDTSIFSRAYIAACIQESIEPGCFQEVMDEYAILNNLAPMKHPTPRPNVLKSINPAAFTSGNNASTSTSQTVNSVAGSSGYSGLSSRHIINQDSEHPTPASNVPPVNRPSEPTPPPNSQLQPPIQPAFSLMHTRKQASNLDDPGFCRKVIQRTQRLPPLVKVGPNADHLVSSIRVGSLSVGELAKYVEDNFVTIEPPKRNERGEFNLDTKFLLSLATRDIYRNKLIWFSHNLPPEQSTSTH